MNFREETIEAIQKSGHQKDDVMFIGSKDGKYRMPIEKFLKASDFEYYEGFGAQEIACDLIIYFKDKSYITRGEYDGSEWWEYNKPLNYLENDSYLDFDKLKVNEWQVGWKSVRSINEEVKYE